MNVIKVVYVILILVVLFTSTLQLKLKQIVILSRHNVRTPLATTLSQITPKTWPKWSEKPGWLTEKGILLEGYMGTFFSAWLKKQNLLPENCPSEEDFYVYANYKQRTMASAKAFINKGFPECNVTVHHTKEQDSIFNPVIHNSSLTFKNIATEQMQHIIKTLQLNGSYQFMEDVLDYKDSELCVKTKACDMTIEKNKIINIVNGKKPNINGPLKISNSAIDAFIMEYYEGLPSENVAWGLLSDQLKWQTVMKISRSYHNVIFNTTVIAKDISEPLVKYLSKIFLNSKETPKVLLLMGHDANIYTVLNGMGFRSYDLKDQYELTPVGSKIVFQKWFDKVLNKNYLKIDYVYQTTEQMRAGVPLNLQNKPHFQHLELVGCNVDDKGFCPWEDFEELLRKLY